MVTVPLARIFLGQGGAPRPSRTAGRPIASRGASRVVPLAQVCVLWRAWSSPRAWEPSEGVPRPRPCEARCAEIFGFFNIPRLAASSQYRCCSPARLPRVPARPHGRDGASVASPASLGCTRSAEALYDLVHRRSASAVIVRSLPGDRDVTARYMTREATTER